MSILVEAFTRNLVFFGVADVILATWGLYGLTKLIDNQSNRTDRIHGLVILIVAVVLLVVVNLMAYHYTRR